MNFASYEDMLKYVFNLEGYTQYLDYNRDFEWFEGEYGLKNKSICISYNGVDSSQSLENSFNALVDENIVVYIKSNKGLDSVRDAAKNAIQNTQTSIRVSDIAISIEFTGGTLERSTQDNTVLVYVLNFSIMTAW